MPLGSFPVHCVTFLVLIVIVRPSCAAPVNASEVSPVYVPDPSGRGTVGLVSSCVLTLSLCVWTAIHLNVFPPGTTWPRRTLYKISWALIGIFAPEIVLWRAVDQWDAARRLRSKINIAMAGVSSHRRTSLRENPNNRTSSHTESESNDRVETASEMKPEKQTQKWTLRQGFFAVMGGITVSTRDEYDNLFVDGRTLTPRGVLALAEIGFLPNIDHDKISVKSKSDQIAKTIVVVQAFWMLIQTIARAASGLPITLLELNTFAHVLCAVFMYAIWWEKPQNVAEPLNVYLEPSEAAMMAIASQSVLSEFVYRRPDSVPLEPISNSGLPVDTRLDTSNRRNRRIHSTDTSFWLESFLPENKSNRTVVGTVIDDWYEPDRQQAVPILYPEHSWEVSSIRNATNPAGLVMLLPGQSLDGIRFFTPRDDPVHLTIKDIERLVLLAELNGERCLPVKGELGKEQYFLHSKASNFEIPGDVADREVGVLSVLSLIYGAVHASSWNSHFPTVAEKIMWRISVCFVGVGGTLSVLFLTLFVVAVVKEHLQSYEWGVRTVRDVGCLNLKGLIGVAVAVLYVVIVSFLAIAGLGLASGFVFGRVFLVVEAFISIRSLPAGAYDTVG